MGGRNNNRSNNQSSNNQSGNNNSASDNSLKQQQQAFAKQQADALAAQKAAQDAAIKAAEEAARQQAIASQSANARSVATTNQQEVSNKLGSTLNTPIQSGTMNYGGQASGYNPAAAKQSQVASMGGGGAMPAPMMSPSAAMAAAKVNADSGGTNAVQNRYTMPNTQGLQFGGS